MSTEHATRPTTPRGPALPASITPALLRRLTARVSAAPDAARVTTSAPYTGLPLADFPVSTPEEVDAAFARARAAQKAWAATPIAERKRILLRYHDLVLARRDEALDLMQAENGKTRRDAFLEVVDIGIVSRYYARNAAKYLSPKRRRGAIPLLTHTTELRHPKGVVTVISPWNYPLSMAASDTIAALMAGNAVVQKPDTQTALTALWSMDLMHEAGLPRDVWQMVIGRGSSIGTPLMDNADYMMFTGSTASGRRIASDAGRRLIGASLELGGKNPMIVLDDADIEKAAEGAVNACFPSAGQLCVSVERLYVAESIRDAFIAAFTARTKKLTIGAAYDYSMDVGSLTTASQLQTVTKHVGDAVALANATSYGLNASVWSRDGARGRAVAARVHAGTVNVNEAFAAAWGSIDAPMGGMGDSGLGRRHGADGILKYTEPQTIAHQRLQGFSPPSRISPETWADLLTGALKVMKAIGMR
ncbi:succinic semialdehyde dehydrogenase [Streptomyces rubiginosohelvolus]|uniref:succinic semialdehyde dehydrogenase n=1 Tax=Streptomyces rubiginosohelvolus TaxID=67362 RepID=UPI003698ABFE